MMDLGQLRSFAEVAERGTVAAAATARGYTAPAVSQHIAKLEAELDAVLFDRVGRRLRLTAAGEALLPIAFEMIELERTGRESLAAASSRPTVVLAGLASALTACVLPNLDALRNICDLEIHEREDSDALADLRLGRAAIALTQEYDGQSTVRDRRLSYVPLFRDQLRIALPPHLSGSTSLADLHDVSWLINGHGTVCATATTTILRQAGIEPSTSGVVADNATLLGFVAAGHGVTIAPELLICSSSHDIRIADEDLGISRTIFGVTSAEPSPVLRSVLRLLDLMEGT